MENLLYVKVTLWLVLILGILAAVGYLVYMLIKAGGGLSDKFGHVADSVLGIFGPSEVKTPKKLQDFMDEPSNQKGGYVPWTPTIEVDESYPPSWLAK